MSRVNNRLQLNHYFFPTYVIAFILMLLFMTTFMRHIMFIFFFHCKEITFLS